MSDTIHVKLPDGSVKDVAKGTSALDIAKSISPRLADAALVAQIKPSSNGTEPKLVDLTRPINEDVDLRLLTERDPEALEVYRHSSAHLLAAAVLELFPETKLGHGPATENGFFYDFLREKPFTSEDLEAIEKKMLARRAHLHLQDGQVPRLLSRPAHPVHGQDQGVQTAQRCRSLLAG